MFNLIQFATFFILGLFQIAIQCIIILLLFKKEILTKKVVLFTIIIGCIQQIPATIIPNKLLFLSIIIYLTSMFFATYFILKYKIVESILATGLIYIISAIIEYIGMAISKISFQSNFIISEWVKSFPMILFMRGLGLALCIATAIIIYYFNLKINFPEDYIKKRSLNIVIAIFISIIIIVPNILYFVNSVQKVSPEYLFFNVISLMILLIFTTYSTVKFEELNIRSQHVEFQNLYIKSLNDTIDGLRSFKHDFNNIMQVFKGYLDLGNIDGAKKYFGQVLGELTVINNTIPINNYLRDNPALYGLLLGKISYSEIKDILFNIHISGDITIRDMKTLDFCKVLGILLDNALEASLENNKKIVELNISRNEKNNQLVVEITNTCSGNVDAEKIFENGFTTKEGHTGFGLYEVKKILGKYSNCILKTYEDNNFFTQKLYIK